MFLESARVRALARASVVRTLAHASVLRVRALALVSASARTRECERYNSRVHREYEAQRTRAESKGLGEESAGPARRTRAESTGLGEDSAGLAQRKSTEARRREHGSLSSECRGVKQKAQRLGGPEQNSEISEGERWLVYTRARRARDVSTYRGAHAGPWPVSFQHSRERAIEHSRVTRERGVEHSRALDGNA